VSGQHEDRHVGAGAQLARDLVAANVGQSQVEHDQIGPRVGGQRDRLGPGARGQHLEPVALEVAPHELADLQLVLDDQHERGHAPGSSGRS
jgi:hypothetical protein